MARSNEGYRRPNDFRDQPGFFGWLNRRLFPYIGPPPVGPYETEPEPDRAGALCPLCRQPMSEHEFDRSVAERPTKIYCPTQPTAA